MLTEHNSTRNLLMKSFRKSQKSALGSIKQVRLNRMKNRKIKAHFVTDSKSHQLQRHCDLLRTIVVLNIIPGSNINIKEIIENCECSSLTH